MHPCQADFIELGKRLGIETLRAQKLIMPFLIKQEKVEQLVSRSFLPDPIRRGCILDYGARRNRLNA